MALAAYILVNVSPGKDRAVARGLSKIRGVKEARVVAGPYDVVAVADAKDTKALGDIMEKVRRAEDVKGTLTLIAVD